MRPDNCSFMPLQPHACFMSSTPPTFGTRRPSDIREVPRSLSGDLVKRALLILVLGLHLTTALVLVQGPMARAEPVTNILVTGQPGCGKSTLINRVFSALPGVAKTGFWTEEVRARGERIGFDVVTLAGQRGVLSRINSTSAKGVPKVGNYVVDVEGFEALALPALEMKDGVQLVVIDEVGKMELFSERFKELVLQALEAPVVALMSVPVARYGREVPFVGDIKSRRDISLHVVRKAEREEAFSQVLEAVKSALNQPSRS